MNWYLIQTKPNSHFIAVKNFTNQNFTVFLPLTSKTFRKNGKFITTTVPLFPSYVFIGSKTERVSWKSVNATRGVSRAVTLDGEYRPISSKIIQALRDRCDEQGILKTGGNILKGDLVKIQRGPLSDFICKIEHIGEKQRVSVLIQLMQKILQAEIALEDLANF